jgi:hypothetical protein
VRQCLRHAPHRALWVIGGLKAVQAAYATHLT